MHTEKITTRKRPHNLVTIGHTGYDHLHTSQGKRKIIGGAAYFTTKGASLFSNRVGIVTRVGRDFNIDFLKRLGIDLSGVKVIKSGNSFSWHSKYDKYFNRVHSLGELNVGEKLKPEDIPNNFLSAKHIHISTMPPQIQSKIISYLRQRGCKAKISIDTVEDFIIKSPKQIRAAILQADIVFLNEREFELLKQIDNLEKQMVVKKRGRKGAELHYQGKITTAKAPRVKVVVDTTGAGDVLAGAFLTLVARGCKPTDALKIAVKTASKSVTKFGVEHLNKSHRK